ncbi:MAG: Do family serine endopeptidase [Planctomycetes bacterium]|jgi:serine protease Do|nr:Do family serine endopeptidase [Planctomycetota bacterium]
MRLARRMLPFGLIGLLIASTAFLGPPVARQIAFAVEAGRQEATITALEELSKHDKMSALFRAVSNAVKPAVVVVHVRQKVAYEPIPFPEMDDFFKRFFGDDLPGFQGPFRFRWETPQRQQPKREFYQRGLGSGVIVDAEKGYVLTNWHVVRDADEVEVVLHDSRKFEAEWVRTDKQTDLAVLKIKPDRLTEARLGDSDELEVGDWVLAIGAPEGLPQTVTAGIISAKGRTTGRDGYENFLQTDAAINHGNSGGPLVNMRGEVVGINTAIVSRTGVNEGIGLSIPSNMVRNIMNQLIDTGEVVRGYLGVTIQNVDEGLARSFDLPGTDGALVSSVMEDSPAEKAGLKEGDFITAVDGKSIANVNELRNRVAAIRPDKTVELEIYRDGEKRTLDVKIGQQPADFASAFSEGAPSLHGSEAAGRFGLKVATMGEQYAEKFGIDADLDGAVVLEVTPGSDAADKGIQPGDVITHVNGKVVDSADKLTDALAGDEAKDGVRLRIRDRQGGTRFVFVTPTSA